MPALLREIQAADFLGYQEMADFRAAVKAREVPAPSRKIRAGRRTVDAWSKRELEQWIENVNDPTEKSLARAIDAL